MDIRRKTNLINKLIGGTQNDGRETNCSHE